MKQDINYVEFELEERDLADFDDVELDEDTYIHYDSPKFVGGVHKIPQKKRNLNKPKFKGHQSRLVKV